LIIAFNKADLPRKIDKDKILARAPHAPHLEVSALKKTNIEKLKELMAKTFNFYEKTPEVVVLHLRQKLLLEEIGRNLVNARERHRTNTSEEIIAEDIRRTLALIGQLTGEITSDDVLEAVFGNFCIGK
jgi:tRNA modification GTPase